MNYDEYAYRSENVRYHIALGMVKVSQYWKPALIGLAILAAFIYGRCGGDPDPVPVQTPAFENIEDDLPPEEPGVVRGITHRQNPVVRAGKAPTEQAKKKAKEFADSHADSTLPAVLPEVKLTYNDDRLDLAVGDSRGEMHRRVTECPEPCSAGVRDNELFSESPRTAGFPTGKIALGAGIVVATLAILFAAR